MKIIHNTSAANRYIREYRLEQYFDNIYDYDVVLSFYRKGEHICKEGEEVAYFYFLVEGKLKIYRTSLSGKSLLYEFYDGFGTIGDVEFALGALVSSNVQAISDAYCICIPFSRCLHKLKSDIKFLNFINAELATKLTRNSKTSLSNLLYPLENRLAGYLAFTAENGIFSENLTPLSEYLGTSYRHLLRTLDRFCKNGYLIKLRKGYKIIDINALRELGDKTYD